MQHALIHPVLASSMDATAIISIVGAYCVPIAIVGLGLLFRHRRRKLLHETLRLMIEKGQPIPPELISDPWKNYPYEPRRRSDLRRGLVWMAIGLALILGNVNFNAPGGFHLGKIGLIPLFIGVAFIIAWLIEGRGKDQGNGNHGGQPIG